MDWLIISWWAGIIGAVVASFGGVYFVIGLTKMTNSEIKNSLFFIFLASFIWTIYSILMIIFVLRGIGLENKLWMIIPLAYILTSISFIIGTGKLMAFLNSLQENYSKKLETKK